MQFTQHGLEKYNDIVTKDYFRCTSHHGENVLLQIMQKRNRLEHLRDHGVESDKRFEITCSSNCIIIKAKHNVVKMHTSGVICGMNMCRSTGDRLA